MFVELVKRPDFYNKTDSFNMVNLIATMRKSNSLQMDDPLFREFL